MSRFGDEPIRSIRETKRPTNPLSLPYFVSFRARLSSETRRDNLLSLKLKLSSCVTYLSDSLRMYHRHQLGVGMWCAVTCSVQLRVGFRVTLDGGRGEREREEEGRGILIDG